MIGQKNLYFLLNENVNMSTGFHKVHVLEKNQEVHVHCFCIKQYRIIFDVRVRCVVLRIYIYLVLFQSYHDHNDIVNNFLECREGDDMGGIAHDDLFPIVCPKGRKQEIPN